MCERQLIDRVTMWLNDANSILFVTGAGISVDSGIPTYRGVGGVWTQNKKVDGVPISEIMTGTMIRQNPELVWKCFANSEQRTRHLQYNRGHQIIAEMERQFERVLVYTQNVDGLHSKAGSRNVIEIHGTLRELCCMQCSYRETVDDYTHLAKIPPECSQCGGLIRPDVILFQEMLPGQKLVRLAKEMEKGFDIVFSIGTTCAFPYVCGPILKLQEQGAKVVEINPDQTDISHLVNARFADGASDALAAIWNAHTAH